MKILIIGGTHGDERTGVVVVSLLKRDPSSEIDFLIANPRAIKLGQRFVETDLNRSFGSENPKSYEERRAKMITPILRKFDLVIEFHNTTSRTTCAILTSPVPTLLQLRTVAHLGLNRILVMPPGQSLSGQNPAKTVSLEISTGEQKFSPEFFVQQITSLSREVSSAEIEGLVVFQYRGVKVSKVELTRSGLILDDFRDFKPMRKKELRRLGLNSDLPQVPFFVGGSDYRKNLAFEVAELQLRERRK